MKNLITIALLCLLTSAYSQEEINENAVEVELTLGRFPNGEIEPCSGRGACSFQAHNSLETSNAVARFNKDQTLTIYIKRDQISEEDELKIAGQEINRNTEIEELTFLMEEELELNVEARDSLRLPEHLTTIATGTYPLIVTEKYFVVTLKLI